MWSHQSVLNACMVSWPNDHGIPSPNETIKNLNKPSDQTRWVCISWPTWDLNTRFNSAVKRKTYQAGLPCHNCVCQSLQWFELHSHAISTHFKWNTWSQECIWCICMMLLHQDLTLPCRQWKIFWCFTHQRCNSERPNNLLLWSKCLFSEWHCRETNLQSTRTGKKTALTC